VISVVIPALNEAANIATAIESALAGGASEVLVVDGGSSDDTVAIAEAAGARVFVEATNRARQLNVGAKKATGDVLLFLHADTSLPTNFRSAVEKTLFSHGVAAGAFSLAIDAKGARYRIVEAVVAIRNHLSKLPYGDQATFVLAKTFTAMDGFADMPIMEDYEFVRRSRRHGRTVILPLRVRTSSRRWQRLGVVRTAILNFFIIAAYHLGVAPDRLAVWYRGAGRRREAPLSRNS
jgi:rSAM/selenodomain-associated transferase 2